MTVPGRGRHRLAEAGRDLLDLLLPTGCLGCGARVPPGSPHALVCPRCRSRLAPLPWPRCRRCHLPLGTGGGSPPSCEECDGWPPCLRGARSAVAMAPPADRLVHALKYEGWREVAGLMARRMARERPPGELDRDRALVVPVPTTRTRRKRRGYNQADVLAEAFSRAVERPLVRALRRRSGGGSQVALQPTERRANVRTAFAVRGQAAPRIRGRPVLLIDDVLTTGATAAAAAGVLERAGAQGVVIHTFARSLPYRTGAGSRPR